MPGQPHGRSREESEKRESWERSGTWVLAGLALAYVVGFAAFYPRTITVTDELAYVRQAQVVATGVDRETITHPLTGESVEREIKTVYPLGTAMLLAPWIALGGWPLAFLTPALCLLGALALTALWLRQEGRSPLAAAVLLGFPAALVLGRVCMSETPSLLWVSLGLLLFWLGIDRRRELLWGAAGLVAGSSLLFRESNALLFAPLFAGAALRRDRAWWMLLLGGLAGVGLRLAASAWMWGDPLHYKSPGYGFGPASLLGNLPLYGLALLVLVPGGLVAGVSYRGRRAPEIVATVVLFVGFYLLYDYGGGSSGLAKQLVLGPRFFVPLLPILAFALAEAVPRWALWLEERLGGHRVALRRAARWGLCLWLAGVALASIGAHAVHARWSASQAAIREAIYETTPEGSVLVTNSAALVKFISPVFGERTHLDRRNVDPRVARTLARRRGAFFVVFLDRSDSEHWRRDARENEAYVSSLRPIPELVHDQAVSPTDRLRIWRVEAPSSRR
ncbi:MAG: hypothetical protein ACQGVK_06860 [Myxococcota bacterium]